MAAVLVVILAALAQSSGASRFHPLAPGLGLQTLHKLAPRTVHGPFRPGSVRHRTAMAHTRGRARTAARMPRTAVRTAASQNMEYNHDYLPDDWKADSIMANWRTFLGAKDPRGKDLELTNVSQPELSATHSSERPVPLPKMYSIDTTKLLDAWIQWMWKARVQRFRHTWFRTDNVQSYPAPMRGLFVVLEAMKDNITMAPSRALAEMLVQAESRAMSNRTPLQSKALEAVVLMPNIPSNESMKPPKIGNPPRQGWSPGKVSASIGVEASVMALAVFSRVVLKDNSKLSPTGYTFREIKMVNGGIRDVSSLERWKSKSFSAFAIEGLAEAPDLPVRSARVLLAKIARWAQAEQSHVMVARQAIHRDGTDLTDYYLKLGFEKLELDDGSYDLVYFGYESGYGNSTHSVTDQWIGDRQFMVRANGLDAMAYLDPR